MHHKRLGNPLCAPETISVRPHGGRTNYVCGHPRVYRKHVGAPSCGQVRHDSMTLYLCVGIKLLHTSVCQSLCVDHNELWEVLKEMRIPDHLTCLLRNLYAGQEATVRTGHGTTDWFQIRKGIFQGCILSPCLFNLYAEYIKRNADLDEAQAGIKIARRNIINLRYADDITLMAESKEELKSLNESERGECKRWLKTQHLEK